MTFIPLIGALNAAVPAILVAAAVGVLAIRHFYIERRTTCAEPALNTSLDLSQGSSPAQT